MNFTESVRRLAAQVGERRSHVETEEAVKQALILPFLHILGFDIYDPREVIPEFKAGWAKVTEKIDYALVIGDKLVMFVEAKGPYEVLANHDPQLAKYFNSTTEIKFAIITNGVQYRFFTDLQEPNLLDKKPFFEFDLERFSDTDISTLEKFRKEVFNVSSLVSYAEDLVFLSALKNEFKQLLRDPSDEFTQFAVKSADLVDGRVTQKVVDRFRPLVKEAISAAILEIVEQSFSSNVVVPRVHESDIEPPLAAQATEGAPEPSEQGVITTEEELRVFQLVTEMLADIVPDPSKLLYRDRSSYFVLQYEKSTRWFARFFLGKLRQRVLIIRLPIERTKALALDFDVREVTGTPEESRVYFNSIEDLPQLKLAFAEAVRAQV